MNYLNYLATKYYDYANYYSKYCSQNEGNDASYPSFIIENPRNNTTNTVKSFTTWCGVPYKSMFLPMNINVDIQQLKNSKLEYLSLQPINIRINDYKHLQLILDKLPETIKYLSIEYYKHYFDYNGYLISNISIVYNKLPSKLKKLYITMPEFNNPLDNLPPALEVLDIQCYKCNIPIDFLPSNLKKLIINCKNFNQSLINLPETLEHLYISCNNFNQSLHNLNNLPNNIKTLSLYSLYLCKTISSNVGGYIEDVIVNEDYKIEKLPDKLEKLNLSNGQFEAKYYISSLPDKLKTIIIVNNCLRNIAELQDEYPNVAFAHFAMQNYDYD
jgi:hypothetical protein